MAAISSASINYDSDIFTNYVQDPQNPNGNPLTIQGYTVHLECHDANGIPMANASLLIQSSVPTIANLNGTTVMLTVNPTRYALDLSGELGIIAPALGVKSPSYTFSNLKDQNGFSANLPITTIDPSRKPIALFENMKTGGQLKTTPGRDGTTLYAGQSPPPDSDLDTAAQALQDLAQAAKSMQANPTDVQIALNTIVKSPLPNDGWPTNDIKLPANAMADPDGALKSAEAQQAQLVANKTKQAEANLLKNLTGLRLSGTSGAAHPAPQSVEHVETPGVIKERVSVKSVSIGSWISSAGHTIKGGFDDAGNAIKDGVDSSVDELTKATKSLAGTIQHTADGVAHQVKKEADKAGWLIDQAKNQWHYVAKFAGQVLDIIIEKMDDIGHAFDKVWTAIKLGWKELEKWAGFLFDWENIIAISKTISTSITVGMDYFAAQARGKGDLFTRMIDVFSKHEKPKPSSAPSDSKASDITSHSTLGSPSGQTAADKWFGHQSKHGGIMNVSSSDPAATPDQFKPGTPEWTGSDKLSSTVNQISSALTKLADDLSAGFGTSLESTIPHMLELLSEDIYSDVKDGFKVVMTELGDLLADLVDGLREMGNAKIHVPIISWLFRQITGEDLTLFNFISLCIAIPSSLLYRAFKGGKRMVLKSLESTSFNPRPASAPLQPAVQSMDAGAGTGKIKTVSHEIKDTPNNNQDPKQNQNQDGGQSQRDPADFADAIIIMGIQIVKYVFIMASAANRAYKEVASRSTFGPCIVSTLKMAAGIYTLYTAVKNDQLPGKELRITIASLLTANGLFNFIVVAKRIRKGYDMGERGLKLIHGADMMATTLNFGLASAVFALELESSKTSWPGRDPNQSKAQEVANGFGWMADMAGAWADLNWDETVGWENNPGGLAIVGPARQKGKILDAVTIGAGGFHILALGVKAWFAAMDSGTDFAALVF